MLRIPYVSFTKHCPRCNTRLETPVHAPPFLLRPLLGLSRSLVGWRWCRNCMWSGFGPRYGHRRPSRSSDGDNLRSQAL
jgi:hypothetical protein